MNYSDPFGLCPKTEYRSICIDLFIAAASAEGLRGDGRDFDAGADATESRAQIVINLDKPEASYRTVTETCTAKGGVCNGPLKDQAITIGIAADGTIGVQFELHNGLTKYPAIDGSIALIPDGKGGYISHGDRNNFPSLGIYMTAKGKMTTIQERREGNPMDLIDRRGVKDSW